MTEYKSKKLRSTIYWLVVISCLLVCSLLYDAARFGWAYAIHGILILSSFHWVLGVIAILLNSSVVIDDQGISRKLFGVTWRRIDWNNVRLVTEFPLTGRGWKTNGVNIFPKVKPPFHIYPSGKISFTEQIEGAEELMSSICNFSRKFGFETRLVHSGEP